MWCIQPHAHLFVLVAALVSTAQAAWGWGFIGHRRLASMMHEPLPKSSCVRQWIESSQSAALQDTSCDPDRWRDSDHPKHEPAEAARHYLDIDVVQPPAAFPRTWEGVVARFGSQSSAAGTVPWAVEQRMAELRQAMQSGDNVEALRRLFVLSHYVTDAHSVLHNTDNSNPGGLHSYYESDMLEVSAHLNELATMARARYGTPGAFDPVDNMYEVVLAGNAQVEVLVDARARSTTLGAFFERVKGLTADRFADALTLMASAAATAWIQAGRPRLSGMSDACDDGINQNPPILKAGIVEVPLRAGSLTVAAGGQPGSGMGGQPSIVPRGDAPTGCSMDPFFILWAVSAIALRRRRTSKANDSVGAA